MRFAPASSKFMGVGFLSLALSSIAFANCGGSTSSVEGGGDGGDGGTSFDSGSTDGGKITGNDSGAGSSVCPSSLPTDQSACSNAGLECEYGSFVELYCDTIASCNGAKWTVSIGSSCVELVPEAGACPATRADVPENEACTDMGLTCEYATGICYCTTDHSGAPQVWTCFPDAGCPYPRPRLGDTCSNDQQECDYSTCGASVLCQDGTWHTGQRRLSPLARCQPTRPKGCRASIAQRGDVTGAIASVGVIPGACILASSTVGASLLRAPPESCECDAFASSLALHLRPSR